MSTPTEDRERIAVLESRIHDLAQDDLRIEALVMDGYKRLEVKIDKLLADSMPIAVARAMARVQTFAGICATGLVSTVVYIATST